MAIVMDGHVLVARASLLQTSSMTSFYTMCHDTSVGCLDLLTKLVYNTHCVNICQVLIEGTTEEIECNEAPPFRSNLQKKTLVQ